MRRRQDGKVFSTRASLWRSQPCQWPAADDKTQCTTGQRPDGQTHTRLRADRRSGGHRRRLRGNSLLGCRESGASVPFSLPTQSSSTPAAGPAASRPPLAPLASNAHRQLIDPLPLRVRVPACSARGSVPGVANPPTLCSCGAAALLNSSQRTGEAR